MNYDCKIRDTFVESHVNVSYYLFGNKNVFAIFFKNTSDGEETEDWPFRGMSVASTLDNRDDLLTLTNFRTIFYKKRI